MLYRETLAALNEEQEKRREAAVAMRTELLNTKELVEDAKEESASLRAELEVLRMRQVELEKAYQNDLRIEQEKEALLEKELRHLRNENALAKRVAELEAEIERLREMRSEELDAEERQRRELTQAKLMEKQIATMEEVYLLQEKLKDYEEIRRELFFALVVGMKMTEASKGRSCNVDAGELWETGQKNPVSSWKAWLEERICVKET